MEGEEEEEEDISQDVLTDLTDRLPGDQTPRGVSVLHPPTLGHLGHLHHKYAGNKNNLTKDERKLPRLIKERL